MYIKLNSSCCTCGGSRPTLGICQVSEAAPMDRSRHVRLFKNGRNQAVRIPRDSVPITCSSQHMHSRSRPHS